MAAGMGDWLIETGHLSKEYRLGDVPLLALNDVSVRIGRGEFVAVMGPSGSGKSTFMNLLGCLDRPTAGAYRLDGRDVSHLDGDALAAVRGRLVGFVFQGFNLLPRTPAVENVELPLVYAGVPADERRRRALAQLAEVGLAGRAWHHPSQLSGGQQQRVAIARALVNEPLLILADEPTGALDSRTSVEIMALFQTFNARGITVVLVTHEPDIAAYARRTLRFRDGRLIDDQPVAAAGRDRGAGRLAAPGGGGMTLVSSLRIALAALRLNLMRSLLTMLGIIIGVGSVITMIAVGAGAEARVAEQISSLGSNLIIVVSGAITSGGVRLGFGTQMTLSEDDAQALQREVPEILVASPGVRGSAQIIYGNLNWSTVVYGTTPDFLTARDWGVAQGRPFEQADTDRAAKVALLGRTVATTLFGGADPVGQMIRIKKVPFTVIGVLDRKGQSMQGQDQDDVVVMPLSTARNRVLGASEVNRRTVAAILVKMRDGADMHAAEAQIHALLRQRHHLQPAQDDDFWMRNLSDVAQAQEASSRVLTLLLAAVASVSLVVGGIGIMNIMLVSVTERTREIGLRLAVGARSRDILGQFLIEAMTLSLLGGLAGIALGATASFAIGRWAHWQTDLKPAAILLAVGFAAAVGIFFGFYPARKASRLQPIEALRYE